MNRTLAVLAIALSFALAPATHAQAPVKAAATKPTAKTTAKPAARAAAPVQAVLPPASGEQLEAANLALLGDYECEFDQKVTLEPYAKAAGYIEMKQKAQAWVMKPVLSSTGALRLEDVQGRMLMIQIANKSMVMDTKIGQRLVDGCMHEKQRAFVATQGELLATPPK